ncbi:Nucleotidyltransferase [Sarracenia purpurea var. burkii]
MDASNLHFYAVGKGHVSSVQPILTAKVPILKVVDRGTGIECDISIENRDGILKSQIVQMISSIDERFPMLSFLVIKYLSIVLILFTLLPLRGYN